MNTTQKKTPNERPHTSSTMALTLVFSGGEVQFPPRRYSPGREEFIIGREAKRGIPLPADPKASRKHASVHKSPLGGLRLVDESSTNGTFVNGKRITDATLHEGDVITVGGSFLVVSKEPENIGDAQVSGLLGVSVAARRVRELLARWASTGQTILITGETGCGKEVAAHAVHALSGREGAFEAVNCAAIPESLAESQFFGHEKAVFTGALPQKGYFRQAERGTLFLDELGELPVSIQAKILRAVEDRRIRPLGATSDRPCDVRIVAATNRDLKAAMAQGAFREDLYARLDKFRIHLPPLRERREDILLLLAHFLGSRLSEFHADAVERLLLHDWPFNVRQVQNLAEKLRSSGERAPYDVDLIDEHLERLASPGAAFSAGPSALPPEENKGAGKHEPPPGKDRIEAALRDTSGNVAEVARMFSRSRKQVYRWIQHHGINVKKLRREP